MYLFTAGFGQNWPTFGLTPKLGISLIPSAFYMVAAFTYWSVERQRIQEVEQDHRGNGHPADDRTS
ncbi:MAG: hypothetical protein AAFY98_06040 [Verrucomicrobiota bacterium]